MQISRRKLLLAGCAVPIAASLVGSLQVWGQAAPSVSPIWQAIVDTVGASKARAIAQNIASNDNLWAANDNTILNAIRASAAASKDLTFLEWGGRVLGAAGLAVVVLELPKYVHATNDVVTVKTFKHFEGSISTYLDIWNQVGSEGSIEWQGYGYAGGYGGSDTALPMVDSNSGWAIQQVFVNGTPPRRNKLWPFVAVTTKPLAGMTDLEKFNLFHALDFAIGETPLTHQEVKDALAAGHTPEPVEQTRQKILDMIKPFFPPDFQPVVTDAELGIPTGNIKPEDWGQDVGPNIPQDPVPNGGSSSSASGNSSSGASSSSVVSSDVSSSSGSSSSTSTADAPFGLPNLPPVPEPPQWWDAWKGPLNSIVPTATQHGASCPVMSLQIPDRAWPSLTMRTQTLDQYCSVGEQMKPTLRAVAAAAAGISALITVLKA